MNYLNGSKYHTIYIDPPWPIRWQHNEGLRMKQLQYPTLPISEIMQLPIDSVAHADCLLLMWSTNEFLPEALGIVRHWKFQYEKLFTWCKNNGMGAHPRNATEHIVMATRGNPPKLRGRNDSMILNWVQLPVTGRHSEKPKEIRFIIEQFAPEPRLEMFARVRHPGWHVWGNEFKSDVLLSIA